MAHAQEWNVVFYSDENGHSPVEEFIDSLNDKAQVDIEWAIKQLCARNIFAREPLVRSITGKLWELRAESNTNIYRIFYFFFTGRQIVFLHGFQKKSQRTPRREIEIALQRLDKFVLKQKGER